jgi:hypothetical protein
MGNGSILDLNPQHCPGYDLAYRVLNVLFSAQAHNITDVVVACRETGLEYRVLHVLCSAQAHNITDVVVAAGKPV